MMFHLTICQHCGKPVPIEPNVCVMCGHRLNPETHTIKAPEVVEMEQELVAA